MELSGSTAGGSSGFRVPRLPQRGSEDGCGQAGVSLQPPSALASSEDTSKLPKVPSPGTGYFHHFAAGGAASEPRRAVDAAHSHPLAWYPQQRPEPPARMSASRAPSIPDDCAVAVARTASAAETEMLMEALSERGYSTSSVSPDPNELAVAILPRPGRPLTNLLLLPLSSDEKLAARAQQAQSTALSLRDRNPGLAIVVVSSKALEPSQVAEARAAGVDDLLRLPLSPEDVGQLWTCASRRASARLPQFRVPQDPHAAIDSRSSSGPFCDHPQSLPCPGDGGPCCRSKAPLRLLDWLTQRPSSSASKVASLQVFHRVLAQVAHHHRLRDQPCGAAILRSFTINEANNISCSGEVLREDTDADIELYMAPEGPLVSNKSDIFTLGCLLFRLLQPQGTQDTAAQEEMRELRDRILPLEFLQQQPCEAALVLSMLHPKPDRRPSVDQVASNAIFDGVELQSVERRAEKPSATEDPNKEVKEEEEDMEEAHEPTEEEEETTEGAAEGMEMDEEAEEAAAEPLLLQGSAENLERAEVVTDVLLTFLRSMRDTLAQQHRVGKEQCDVMDSDLDLVLKALHANQEEKKTSMRPMQNTYKQQQQQEDEEDGEGVRMGSPLKRKRRTCPENTCPGVSHMGVFDSLMSRPEKVKAKKPPKKDLDMFSCLEPEEEDEEEEEEETEEEAVGGEGSQVEEQVAASEDRWRRLEGHVPAMESMYLQRWKEFSGPSSQARQQQQNQQQAGLRRAGLPGHLCSFAEDLGKFSKYGSLTTHASLVQSGSGSASSSQMISSMSFGCGDEMFATAGTATRKIKLYQVQPLLRRGSAEALSSRRLSSAAHYPLLEMETESKLSSICWNQYLRNYLVSAEYSGAVGLWDTAKGELITSFSEHAKRTWAVDCSPLDPKRMLSAGDDSTLRLWSVSDACSGAVIRACAPIYSARFSPTDANVVAVGCANYRTFLYDLRHTAAPLLQIGGHKKAVSYVQFMGGDKLVTASIDSTVKLWDLPASAGRGEQPRLRCCFKDHTNEKIFVGLAVREDGYILCGSETNEVHCYYSGLPVPILKHDFADSTACAGRRPQASSVCWSATSNLFLAANTAGRVDLLEMTTS